jgi:hypothetical protein
MRFKTADTTEDDRQIADPKADFILNAETAGQELLFRFAGDQVAALGNQELRLQALERESLMTRTTATAKIGMPPVKDEVRPCCGRKPKQGCTRAVLPLSRGNFDRHLIGREPAIVGLSKYTPAADDHCEGCGAPTGTLHHWGCWLEVCPACRGMLRKCGCAVAAGVPYPEVR